MSDEVSVPTPRRDSTNRSERRALSRRAFVTLAGVGGAAAGAVGLTGAHAEAATAATQPKRTPIAKLRDLKVGQAHTTTYPDERSPIVILKLGKRVPDGVGPDGDIVAYSNLCTHMGCPVAYHADTHVLACPCHYSSFDPARGGMQIMGQATTNLPQVILDVRGEDLIALGMRGLIWGRQNNSQRLG